MRNLRVWHVQNSKVNYYYVETILEAIKKIKKLRKVDSLDIRGTFSAYGLTEQTEDSIQISKENGDFEETGGFYEWYNIEGKDIMELINNEEKEPITAEDLRSDGGSIRDPNRQ